MTTNATPININDQIIHRFERMVTLEKRTSAEILRLLVEVDRRKLYIGKGYTSLFAYMTEGLKYSPSSAQRRIEAARLLREMPEMSEKFESGDLNLTQVSLLSHGLRQQPIPAEARRDLIAKISGRDLPATQRIICQELDLPLLHIEKVHQQKDASHRIELTFSADQMAHLQRLKEVISHTHAGEPWSEILSHAVRFFLKKRDPLWENPTSSPMRSEISREPIAVQRSGPQLKPMSSSTDKVTPLPVQLQLQV